jgi:hypothetical protein
MNKILLLCGVVTLLSTAGCLVADDGRRDPYRDHPRIEGRSEVIVADPVLVVRPPEVIVR